MRLRLPLFIRFFALACLLAAGDGAVAATQLSWYGDGKDLGGSGSWDTTSLDWSANGLTFVAWSNSGNNGATFDYGSAGPGNVVIAAPITAGNLTFNDTGFTLSGYDYAYAITLAGSASVYVASGSQATISAVSLAGTAGMTLSGGGELVLASSNAYSGSTTVSNSYLQLADSSALTSGNLVIDGGVIELGAGNFTRSLGSGTNQVQFTSNGGGFAAVGSYYYVNLGSSSATVTWGSNSFLPSSGSTSATLILGSPAAMGTIDFQNPINLGNAVRTVQVNMGSGTAAVDAKLSGALSGTGGLIVTGDGTLALTASNIYSGGTTVSSGVLSVQNSSGLGSGGVTLGGGTLQLATALSVNPVVTLAADSGIDVTGVTAATLGNLAIGGNTLYVTGGAIGANAAYSLTLGSGSLTGNATFNVANNGSGIATLTLGALNDGGTATILTKAGSGVLILSNAATSLVEGTTVSVTGGTLKSNNATALGSYARVTVTSGAMFDLGASQQISSLAGPGGVALGGNLLTVGNNDNQSSTFSGVISGSGSFAKQGSGTLILSGSDTYTGGTNIKAGTLVAAANGAIPNGTGLTVGAGGRLILNSTAIAGPLAGSPLSAPAGGAVSAAEPGTLVLLIAGLAAGFGVWRGKKLKRVVVGWAEL